MADTESSVHRVIAERRLQGSSRGYAVRIGAPFCEDGKQGFSCPWWVVDESGGVLSEMTAYGEDSVQALMLALVMIGDTIALSWEPITWGGILGSGFPETVFAGTGNPADSLVRYPKLIPA